MTCGVTTCCMGRAVRRRFRQCPPRAKKEGLRGDAVASRRRRWRSTAFVSYMDGIGWGAVRHAVVGSGRRPLHLAKMFKYVSDARESRDKKLAQRCTFCADAVSRSALVFRRDVAIAMYPHVCWSAHVEATRYFPKGLPEWTCVRLIVDVVWAPSRTGSTSSSRSRCA